MSGSDLMKTTGGVHEVFITPLHGCTPVSFRNSCLFRVHTLDKKQPLNSPLYRSRSSNSSIISSIINISSSSSSAVIQEDQTHRLGLQSFFPVLNYGKRDRSRRPVSVATLDRPRAVLTELRCGFDRVFRSINDVRNTAAHME